MWVHVHFAGILAWLLTCAAASGANETTVPLKCLMYFTGQHPVVPSLEQLRHVSHVALAFMNSNRFNEEGRIEWPLFITVEEARRQFVPGTQVMVAIGGWDDTQGFAAAARTARSRRLFARNIARMVEATGADGVDIDWEYPGGNGEDYKSVPNEQKAWEIDAYPLLLAEIRAALGPRKIISAAVPGKPGDMLAFTKKNVPEIMNHVDFLNVMTYDLMNRRDNVTLHHSGIGNSLVAIDAYVTAGAAPRRLNLGLAFYVKYFRTEHEDCKSSPIGCRTLLMEDPETGADLGRTGGFSYHDSVPVDVTESFKKALTLGKYDDVGGGYYYWDGDQDLWWTFDTPDAIARKFPRIVAERGLGGVFAWGLGEDAPQYRHLRAVNEVLDQIKAGEDSEVRDEL